jgi:hypothetical protein
MNGQQIFGIQVVLSFVAYGLMIRWYVSPRLATLPLERTLQPLLVLHTFRHLGLVFLVPTVVGHALPPRLAMPAAYGDLMAEILALAAMAALCARPHDPRCMSVGNRDGRDRLRAHSWVKPW